MAEITTETVTTKESDADTIVVTPVEVATTKSQTFEYAIYYILGALEILLAFRLVLKLMGASMSSSFVGFVYGLSGLFILPFEGIFRRGLSQGIETTSILEPATLVALLVYAVLAWGVVKLVKIASRKEQV